MMKRYINIGLAANTIIAGVVLVMVLYRFYFLPLSAVKSVTELDRAGIFRPERLAEAFPALANNVRYNVAAYVVEDFAKALSCVLLVLSFSALVNILLFIALRRQPPTRNPDKPVFKDDDDEGTSSSSRTTP